MSNDVAILLDLDNAVIGASEANLTFDINLLLEYVKKLTGGRIVFRRSYGDWRQHHSMPKQLAAAGFEMQTTVNQMSKNLADMQMVVDAMETLIEGHDFQTYVLVTGDRDFMPLVQALRRRGKVVIGIGVKHTTSRTLLNLCDKFVYYEDILAGMQLQADQVQELLHDALAELAREQDRVPASTLKQQMMTLSGDAFGQTRFGKMSFTKFLEANPDLVTVIRDGTTVYATQPGQIPKHLAPPADAAPVIYSSEDLAVLLSQALNNTLNGHDRVRASVLKEELATLSEGRFDETAQGAATFSALLRQYPSVVALHQKGSTLYVAKPEAAPEPAAEAEEVSDALYQRYLKQQGLRVVPPKLRLLILREIINRLKAGETLLWRDLVDGIYQTHGGDRELGLSKSLIHDALKVAERAAVISADMGDRSFTTLAPVRLILNADRPYQDAVMRCDAVYLRTLRGMAEPVDLNLAATALYDTESYARYLKIVLSHYGHQDQAAAA
jgi:uncharacterized protein (TIGR00288 family)